MDLLSEPVEVELSVGPEAVPAPRTFSWRGERYEVAQVLGVWTDAGFADRARRHHGWWERRHRNYFRLQTADGETWDLYQDRGGGRRRWFALRRWRAEERPAD
jgi:hypothetical protein